MACRDKHAVSDKGGEEPYRAQGDCFAAHIGAGHYRHPGSQANADRGEGLALFL